jgi:uncharacterized protein
MIIEVGKIPESGIILEAEESPHIMEETLDAVECSQPIHVKVSVNLVGRTLVVQGRIITTAVLECNRCLKKFDHHIEVADYHFIREVSSDETIDLTDSIREDIILELPMKRLCSPGCKGLCPICGRDRNLSMCHCQEPQSPGPFSQLDSLES